MKKTLLLIPVAALTIGGGALFAGNALLPQAEEKIELKMDAAEMKVEETMNSALAKVGVPQQVDNDHTPIETAVGYVDIDDDFTEVPTNIITAQQAADIAKKHAKGTLTDIELEHEHDGAHYEIEFEDGQVEYTVNLHAITGEVVYVEEDRD